MKRTALQTAAFSVVMLAALAAVAPWTGAGLSAQGAARLSGRILAEDGSEPVVRARVTVIADGLAMTPALTDAQGRFDVPVPDSRAYRVVVVRGGYLRAVVQRRAGALEPLDVQMVRSAVVAGRAVDPVGRPVAAVGVRVQRLDGTPIGIESETDDRGEYRIGGLAAGRYTMVTVGRPEVRSALELNVNLPEGVTSRNVTSGRDMPTSDPVAFEARPGALTEVTVVFREPTIILPYALVGGVVSGDVVDEWGQPAEGVGVQLWRTMFQGGRPMLAPYGAPRTTDDRGQYRLFHIPAGRYVLVAADPSWRADGEPAPWLPVFYPGRASHADAVPLQVGRSQELGGVNMIFARRRGSRVFGVALDGEGRPQTRVTLVSSGVAATVAQRPRTATANPDGSFEFTGLPPGDYMVRARNVPVIAPGAPAFAVAPGAPPEIEAAIRALAGTPAGSNPPIEVAMQPVTLIDADVGPVIMKTAPAATLRGRVVFQGNRRDTPFTISAVTNDPAFAETSGSQVIAQAGVAVPDGTFELRGLAGPIRLVLAPQIASPMLGRELQAGAPSGWWLKSARVGASDAAKEFLTFDGVTDSRDDVEIVVAETAAAVSGAVVDSQGQTVGDGWVVIFSTDREQWFLGSSAVRAINIGSGGRFSVASLPPGGYFIAALDAIEGNELNGEWQYPELLEMLAPVARRVTLSESQRLTIQQRLVLMSRIP